MTVQLGGNELHLERTRRKVDSWIDKMKNGHLPPSMGWIAHKFQLWSGVRYKVGTRTNDLEETKKVLNKKDDRMLKILGTASTVKKGWL